MNTLNIGELSKSVGLPTKTIRYYEEIGLITSSRRENNYRFYTPDVAEDLKMIKSARDLGLPISEIKKLMTGCENGDCKHSSNYLSGVVTNYIRLLDRQILQMSELRNRLALLEENLRDDTNCDDPKYCCNILHQLVSKEGGV